MSDRLPVSLSLFPGGRSKALTLSYDDGVVEDRRLVEIFNRHGLRGTFHLNSGSLGREGNLAAKEVAALFAGHEVSAHSVTHPFLEQLPLAAVIQELTEDRRRLEDLCGYPVRGMSYPFGTWNRQIVSLLPAIGIKYARTVNKTGNFDVPEDFLAWHPTIHHNHDLLETAQRFIDIPFSDWRARLKVFYVWGHSYEFERQKNWELMEQFGEKIGGRKEIWYATNIEIADYVQALRRVEFSADFGTALNPTAADLWVQAGKNAMRLAPGSLTDLRSGESRMQALWRA
jgi:peptidoglycan/xylan/chitin deacetylase (PgdA/CDA1 family)